MPTVKRKRKRYGLRLDQERLKRLAETDFKYIFDKLSKYGNKRVKRNLSNRYLRKVTGDLWKQSGAFSKGKQVVFHTTWYGVIWNEDKSIAYSKISTRKHSKEYYKRYYKRLKTRTKKVLPKWRKVQKRPFIRDAIHDTIKYGWNEFKKLKRGRF